ncbi:MAG: Lpg1974 family pore-forming outer membrane protein [Gammaproteobacteria bacterium]
MKYFRLIPALAVSCFLAAFSAQAYDKDGDGKNYHHKKHPAPDHRFSITGGATYLAPSMDSLNYASVVNTTDPNSSAQSYNLNPDYDWGYFLAAGYMISDRYDIQASWAQFNSDASDSVTAAPEGITTETLLTSNQTGIPLAPGDVATASSHETLKTEAFDITLGQYHRLAKTLTARPFVGIGYAKINSETVTNYTTTTDSGNGFDSFKSNFSGWGPKVGVDAEYTVWDKLGVVGHMGAAFLVGSQEAESNQYSRAIPALSVPLTQSFAETNAETRIVPALDAKLGLGWNNLYASNSWGLGIEGGYQVAYYFNAVNQFQGYLDGGSPTMINNFEDVSIMGPYLNLSLDF